MVSLKDFENLNLSHSEYLKFDFTLKIPVHASRWVQVFKLRDKSEI